MRNYNFRIDFQDLVFEGHFDMKVGAVSWRCNSQYMWHSSQEATTSRVFHPLSVCWLRNLQGERHVVVLVGYWSTMCVYDSLNFHVLKC